MKTYSFDIEFYVTAGFNSGIIHSEEHLNQLHETYDIDMVDGLTVQVPDDVVAQIIQDYQISLDK